MLYIELYPTPQTRNGLRIKAGPVLLYLSGATYPLNQIIEIKVLSPTVPGLVFQGFIKLKLPG